MLKYKIRITKEWICFFDWKIDSDSAGSFCCLLGNWINKDFCFFYQWGLNILKGESCMRKNRFLINLTLICIACMVMVGAMAAMLLAKISQTSGFLIIVISLAVCCCGLAWTNYRYNAYGRQFASRYPDAGQKKKIWNTIEPDVFFKSLTGIENQEGKAAEEDRQMLLPSEK